MPEAEILLFPTKDGLPRVCECPCGGTEFLLDSDWVVHCWSCGVIVGFWNPLQPVEGA